MSGWVRGPGRPIPEEVRRQMVRRRWSGVPSKEVQAEFSVSHQTLWLVLKKAGGMAPAWPTRSSMQLSLLEREEISRGLVIDESFASIGRRLGR